MARYFHQRSNVWARGIVLGVPLLAAVAGFFVWQLQNSPYATAQDVTIDQPIPFSHQHHVQQLGIDCRYCHTSVDKSSFAGIPSTKTCMSCHTQIWTNAPMLQPVRDSWKSGEPLKWNRVHNTPDYVYFNHQAHISHGVGCSTCHGKVNEMPLVRQTQPLTMSWCLDCHRNPEKFIRPREEVFNMDWQPPANQSEVGKALVEKYHVRSPKAMSDCNTCHR